MGVITRIEGLRAGELPEALRERLGLDADDVVDLNVVRRGRVRADPAALDRAIQNARRRLEGSGVTASSATDFLYDEDGLPA